MFEESNIGYNFYFLVIIATFLFQRAVPSTISVSELEEFEERKMVTNDKVSKIDVELGSGNIQVYPNDKEEILIEFNCKGKKEVIEDLTLTVDEVGDQLKISVSSDRLLKIFTLREAKLNMALPDRLYKQVKINSASGNVKIESLKADDVVVENSSGNILLKNVISRSSQLHSSSGNVKIDHLIGDLTVESSSGNAEIILKEIDQTIEVDLSSGNVFLNVEEEPTSLNLDFNSFAGTGNVDVQMDYEIKSSNRIKGTLGSRENEVKVNISSGNFDFKVTD
ncbi:DUF4097 family beta strand repeat-containing protein [Bacillus carboniphilus]|uniref:DUF4097 family beta strand repeat-containing protein n=1 Tax=Bacillus carboniphilus TaxID=86663 RepID=A0ABY9JU29_9BACI|nr:DUF4097 family beta strand repeat-containing protein [Bacillus carboniphilus]WLR41808.1 DUF4097 family beta strand repeat-containing protein [Bacillus carboniphilus]